MKSIIKRVVVYVRPGQWNGWFRNVCDRRGVSVVETPWRPSPNATLQRFSPPRCEWGIEWRLERWKFLRIFSWDAELLIRARVEANRLLNMGGKGEDYRYKYRCNNVRFWKEKKKFVRALFGRYGVEIWELFGISCEVWISTRKENKVVIWSFFEFFEELWRVLDWYQSNLNKYM